MRGRVKQLWPHPVLAFGFALWAVYYFVIISMVFPIVSLGAKALRRHAALAEEREYERRDKKAMEKEKEIEAASPC